MDYGLFKEINTRDRQQPLKKTTPHGNGSEKDVFLMTATTERARDSRCACTLMDDFKMADVRLMNGNN